MNGFIFHYRDSGIATYDVLRLDSFPDHFEVNGENPNTVLRSYLSDSCVPLYQYIGSTDDWNTHGVLIADEPSDIEGDGNYFKIIFETGEPGEFLIKGGEVKSAVTPDGSFQGVSYKEIYEAINEAIRNDKDDNQPTVPSNCGLADVGPGLHGANFKPPGAKA